MERVRNRLTDDAVARLGGDALLLEGSPERAERLLGRSCTRVLARRAPTPDIEGEIRAAMARLHARRRWPRRASHGPGSPLATLSRRERAAAVLCLADGLDVEAAARAMRIDAAEARASLLDAVACLSNGGPSDVALDLPWLDESIQVESRRR